MRRSAGLYLQALLNRLVNTCSRRIRSPSSQSGLFGQAGNQFLVFVFHCLAAGVNAVAHAADQINHFLA